LLGVCLLFQEGSARSVIIMSCSIRPSFDRPHLCLELNNCALVVSRANHLAAFLADGPDGGCLVDIEGDILA